MGRTYFACLRLPMTQLIKPCLILWVRQTAAIPPIRSVPGFSLAATRRPDAPSADRNLTSLSIAGFSSPTFALLLSFLAIGYLSHRTDHVFHLG